MANSETSRGLVHRIELQPAGRRRCGCAPVRCEAIRARAGDAFGGSGGGEPPKAWKSAMGGLRMSRAPPYAISRETIQKVRTVRSVSPGRPVGEPWCAWGRGKGVDRRGRGIAATRLDHVPHQLARRCLRRRHSGVADLVVEPRPRRLVSANTMERGRMAFRSTRSKSDVHVNSWTRR